jgi:aldehyde dehydrogenase (NAD+)
MKSDVLAQKDYGIANMLQTLRIKEFNHGASTGIQWHATHGEVLESYSSSDGALIAKIHQATADDYEKVITKAQEAWRNSPADWRWAKEI